MTTRLQVLEHTRDLLLRGAQEALYSVQYRESVHKTILELDEQIVACRRSEVVVPVEQLVYELGEGARR